MSTDAAFATQSPAPAAPPVETGEMTPAEREYFTSRGAKTEQLAPQTAPKPAQNGTDAVTRDNGEMVDATKSSVEGIEDLIDGEIEVGEDGTPRDRKTGRYVPKSQYLRKYNEAKDANQSLAKTREDLVRARERLAVLTEAFSADGQQQQAKAEPVAEPDAETDIFGAFNALKKKYDALESKIAASDESIRAEREQRDIQSVINADMKQFYSKEPAIVDAFNFLLVHRDQEYEALGVEDAVERKKMVLDDARTIMAQAVKAKKSPAERVFQIAKLRGFQGAAPKPSITPEATAGIDRINQGQQASQSLRHAGTGASVEAAMTPARIASMSDTEFAEARSAHIAKHGRASWNKLLGM